MYLVYLLLGFLAGAILPVQLALNNQLRYASGSPLMSATISFLAGTAALLASAVVVRAPFPSPAVFGHAPWYVWVGGGCIGAVYVTLSILLAPKLGPLLTFALIVAGQTINAALIEHFGLLGFEQHPLTAARIGGVLLLVGGVVLIRVF